MGSVFQYRTMSVNEHNSSINLAELSQKCINAVSHGIDPPLGHGGKNNKDPIGSMTDGSVTIFTTHLHLICRILVRILGKDCWVEKINLPSVCKHVFLVVLAGWCRCKCILTPSLLHDLILLVAGHGEGFHPSNITPLSIPIRRCCCRTPGSPSP